MSSACLVSLFETVRRLSSLPAGIAATVVSVHDSRAGSADRLAALGVTPGAAISVLQVFPAFVVQCDETELALEPAVARGILVSVD